MSNKKQKNGTLYKIAFFFIFLISPLIVFASSTDGTINSAYKYAWSENIGWINFGCDSCNVHITDSALTGYAWSENFGWINLNPPTSSGVENNNEGVLSGYAWGEKLGWINFSGATIDSNGQFQGLATGDNTGRINFNYDPTPACPTCTIVQVMTDWRPRNVRPACNNSLDDDNDGKVDYPSDPGCFSLDDTTETGDGGGGLPSEAFVPPKPSYGILINDGAVFADSRMVTLRLSAGADVKNIAISNYPDFSNIGQENYVSEKSWDLCFQRSASVDCPAENTVYTVYVKFYNNWGFSSEAASDSIVYVKEIPKKSLVERLPEVLKPFVPEFLKPKPPAVEPPEIPLEEQLPKETPLSLKSQWLLLDSKAIGRLVFAPLPQDIQMLALKLPQLGKTFSELGITRMSELGKLINAKLNLPGLTETLGLSTVNIEPGKFALSRGIPIAKLSAEVRQKIPTEIIFAKTGGELIDFNTTLSFTEKGTSQQTITTISGKPLELVIKPDKPVKAIKGYVVFKSKNSQPGSSMEIPLSSLTASLFFAKPFIAQIKTQPAEIEEKLVLMEFEYADPDGDGIYTAEIQTPIVEGEYEIITVIDYQDPALGMKEIRLIAVVDPEGYVYEKSGDKETRIPKAIISLYLLNSETKQYELWPAKEYQQENPQITDITGKYSFLVPEGFYYLKVDAPGYLSYNGKPFQVTAGSGIHANIELKIKYWWLKITDYKIIILILIVILLGYNFYRDRLRERLLKKKI